MNPITPHLSHNHNHPMLNTNTKTTSVVQHTLEGVLTKGNDVRILGYITFTVESPIGIPVTEATPSVCLEFYPSYGGFEGDNFTLSFDNPFIGINDSRITKTHLQIGELHWMTAKFSRFVWNELLNPTKKAITPSGESQSWRIIK